MHVSEPSEAQETAHLSIAPCLTGPHCQSRRRKGRGRVRLARLTGRDRAVTIECQKGGTRRGQVTKVIAIENPPPNMDVPAPR